MIGVNSQIETGSSSDTSGNVGIGFAIPSNTVKTVIAQLIREGHIDRAFLGISATPITRDLARVFRLPVRPGLLVQSVQPGSGAAKAGLEAGTTQVVLAGESYNLGGDIVVAGGRAGRSRAWASSATSSPRRSPATRSASSSTGQGKRKTIDVKLGRQPGRTASRPQGPPSPRGEGRRGRLRRRGAFGQDEGPRSPARGPSLLSRVIAWPARRPGRLELALEELDLLEDEELWTDDDEADHAGWFCVATDPFPVPGRGLLLRRRVHDRRPPDPRLGGARRSEPAPPCRAREAGRPQPAGDRVRALVRAERVVLRLGGGGPPGARRSRQVSEPSTGSARRARDAGGRGGAVLRRRRDARRGTQASRAWSARETSASSRRSSRASSSSRLPSLPGRGGRARGARPDAGGDRRAGDAARAARLRGRSASAGLAARTRRSSRCRGTSRWPRRSATPCARQLVCGLHVHVSVPDADTALRAFESVVPWLPVLLALSANSPFADGADTGRRSERARAAAAAADRRDAAGAPELGRLAGRHRQRLDPPALGRVAAARVRHARGARDGHADRRAQLGRLRRDRARARLDGAGHRRDVRPGALRAPPRGRPRGSRPTRTEVEALAAQVEPALDGEELELARLVLEGRPEAERQLEIAAAGGLLGRPRGTSPSGR